MRSSTFSAAIAAAAAAGLGLVLAPGGASAQEDGGIVAYPEDWQVGFQPAASPVMERVTDLHDLLLWIITAITIFVLGLIGYACWRFRADRNPVPSKRTHHTLMEITWTAVPVLILVVIAVPSFKLLYFQERLIDRDMTIKAIGNQWFWTYEYPDHGNFTFDAYMIQDADLEPGQPRLLATDNAVVVPIETNIRVLTTGSDVIHSWSVPAFGIKQDAVPGRLNETWFRVDEPGLYYGQCYELCGALHPFMPIMVRAVPQDEFEAWVEQAQQEFARADGAPVEVAAAPAAAPAK